MQTAQREVQTFSPVRMIHFCELTSLLFRWGHSHQHLEGKSAENPLPRLSATGDCKSVKRARVCPHIECAAHGRKSTPIPFRRGRSAKDERGIISTPACPFSVQPSTAPKSECPLLLTLQKADESAMRVFNRCFRLPNARSCSAHCGVPRRSLYRMVHLTSTVISP